MDGNRYSFLNDVFILKRWITLEGQVTLNADVSVTFLCLLLDYSTYYEKIWLQGKYIPNVLWHVN